MPDIVAALLEQRQAERGRNVPGDGAPEGDGRVFGAAEHARREDAALPEEARRGYGRDEGGRAGDGRPEEIRREDGPHEQGRHEGVGPEDMRSRDVRPEDARSEGVLGENGRHMQVGREDGLREQDGREGVGPEDVQRENARPEDARSEDVRAEDVRSEGGPVGDGRGEEGPREGGPAEDGPREQGRPQDVRGEEDREGLRQEASREGGRPGDDPTRTQADGLPPLGGVGGTGRTAGGRGRFLPANPVETELVRAADEESLVKALIGADLLLPVPAGTDPAARPSRPGFPWQPGEIDGAPAVPAFTSPERLVDAIGQVDYVRVPFPIVARHWPEPNWTLAINPGTPASATLPGQQLPLVSAWSDQLLIDRPGSFTPQNELEHRLHDAAQRRDAETFFGLLASAQVMIPADPDTPWGARPGEPDFPWHPVPLKGEPSIMAFTSPRWMHEAVGQSRFVMPDFRELAANWPEHGWSLVLNPGTPIDLTVPGDRLRAAVTPAEPLRARPEHFEPGNRVDQDLDAAALVGDGDDFLRVALAAEVLVPVPATAPEDLSPEHPDFDWSAALSASPPGPGASVRVFTSHLRLQETVGDVRYITVGFADLIAHWRRTDWTLHLNPGTRIGASLTGEQVRELSEWAASVGLPVRQREFASPLPAPRGPEGDPKSTSAENPVVDVPAPREQGPQATVMQKVLPHNQVGWYLEQGYDRVGGFVHPLADCAELTTPVQLYEALGLLYPGSPFDPSDESVYVLRWPAYCEGLYRVPFGGRTEEDLKAWGDAGWVVEHGPFTGDGFAPGSAGSIREFKSESTRLPTGAELYLIAADRTATLIAVYDADVMGWTPAQQIKEVPQ